jgi:outer membrane receptor protein involved in Fe transport
MKALLNGASSFAILAGLTSLALAQNAQQQIEQVVVTGSLIKGTPLTTALPVQVISEADLENKGSPTALDFVKNLTISGPTGGEAYYFGGIAPGSVSINLRSLGADKTLTLFNGRRTSGNTSNIPQIALARTEILEDGAATTYGADATGGVVNFITRDKFVGLEGRAKYRYVDSSAGEYSLGFLGGVGEDKVNLMVSAEWEHRSRLRALNRHFVRTSLDPTNPHYNPAPWSTLTNLTGWQPRGPLPAIPSATANGEFGAPLGGLVSDFTPSTCAAVGGRYDNAFTCAYDYVPYYDLVETQEIYRGYAQLNAEVTSHMHAHMEASFAEVSVPEAFGSPAQPAARGPAMATGATNQFYVPITNPFAAEFAARKSVDGATGITATN